MSLESQLHEELLSLHQRTGRATGYWPSYFLRSVRARGGLAVAKKLLHPGSVSSGFDRLIEARRADLSVEAIASSVRFSSLFTDSELAEARKRLDGLPENAWPQHRESPYPEEGDSKEGAYREGTVTTVLVNRYERDVRARAACIRHHGARCVVCAMDFEQRYGDLGRGFIHVHHLRPLSGRGYKSTVDPKKDLVPVCPNCHAMLHRTDPPLDIEGLRHLLRST